MPGVRILPLPGLRPQYVPGARAKLVQRFNNLQTIGLRFLDADPRNAHQLLNRFRLLAAQFFQCRVVHYDERRNTLLVCRAASPLTYIFDQLRIYIGLGDTGVLARAISNLRRRSTRASSTC